MYVCVNQYSNEYLFFMITDIVGIFTSQIEQIKLQLLWLWSTSKVEVAQSVLTEPGCFD